MKRHVQAAPGRWLAQLCLALAAVLATARVLAAALPSAYFAATESTPTDESAWANLAGRFPLRVKASASIAPEAIAFPRPQLVQLSPGVAYLRLHDLGDDLTDIAEARPASALILDFRFLRSGLEDSLALGRVLARSPLAIERASGDAAVPLPIEPADGPAARAIIIGLVNRETSGPLEAVLDALQAQGSILLVGERTAGDVGEFESPPDRPGWAVIVADYRRTGGPSLLESGVMPGLAVTVAPDADRTAYRAFDAGTPLTALLDTPVEKARFDEARLLQQHGETNNRSQPAGAPRPSSSTTAPPSRESRTDQPPEKPAPNDRVLQRAVNTIVALRALRRFPDS